MAGYSGTPLVNKIGIKPGHRVVLRNDPPSFLLDLGRLPDGVTTTDKINGRTDVAVYFTDKKAVLERDFRTLARALVDNGMLWIAWPKKASGKPTDLNEDVVRKIGLACGLVDVKVCAIDDTWSGLKFVIRLEDRAPRSKPTKPTSRAAAASRNRN